MNPEKPFSQACENNQAPIFTHLARLFSDRQQVLEVGSGTGQHAVYFGERLPHLTWQTSDLPENHAGIKLWLDDYPGSNLRPPLAFNVNGQWPALTVDGLFTANTLHIMSWASVQQFFAGLPGLLAPGALLVVYGPFNYGGQFTSDSNARFEQWLKSTDPERGIRDFEAVCELATGVGLTLLEDNPMPANNRLLVWRYQD
ncbi:DUF938 domain-containing protein [Halioxenophilus sp. WMMB6]|uniref:DUF938 domain-containing protein n=1 Tax=Halioxenophilus sp. WMMB6 TaxID=3073815 RepID=UPI00295E5F4C|nr:DUF938 domain-containing protein [Halioxenophilus sp. WMMB6]